MTLSRWKARIGLTLAGVVAALCAAPGCTAIGGLDAATQAAIASAPESNGVHGGPIGTEPARDETPTAAPSSATHPPPATAPDVNPVMLAALAQVDALPNLPPDQRAQLKQDIAQSNPATLKILVAMMAHLSAAPQTAPQPFDAPGAFAMPNPGTLAGYPPPSSAPELGMVMPTGANVPYSPYSDPAQFPSPQLPLYAPNTPVAATPAPPNAAASTPPTSPPPFAPPSNPAPEAANPVAPARPLAWRQHLKEAIAGLRRELADQQHPRRNADRVATPASVDARPERDAEIEPDGDRLRLDAGLRLLLLAAGEQDDALRRIESADAAEQDYWAHQLSALATLLDADGPPIASRRAALALRELREATAHLAAASTLEVRNLALCREVQGYGVYTKFSTYDFTADQEVLLYVEVDNLLAAETRGGYKTIVQGSFRVLDSSGRAVFDHTFPPDEETCVNRRRDYFIPYRTYIPRLSPGDYTLQLTLEDVQARKFGQSTLALRVKGK